MQIIPQSQSGSVPFITQPQTAKNIQLESVALTPSSTPQPVSVIPNVPLAPFIIPPQSVIPSVPLAPLINP